MTTRSTCDPAGEPDTGQRLDLKGLRRTERGRTCSVEAERAEACLKTGRAAMKNSKSEANAVTDLRSNPEDVHCASLPIEAL